MRETTSDEEESPWGKKSPLDRFRGRKERCSAGGSALKPSQAAAIILQARAAVNTILSGLMDN